MSAEGAALLCCPRGGGAQTPMVVTPHVNRGCPTVTCFLLARSRGVASRKKGGGGTVSHAPRLELFRNQP